MGFSRVFLCFKDHNVRTSRKQKQLGKRTRDGGERPNRGASTAPTRGASAAATGGALAATSGEALAADSRRASAPATRVASTAASGVASAAASEVASVAKIKHQSEIEMQNLAYWSSVQTSKKAKHLAAEVYEPEPWSVAAVARRTSLFSVELAELRSQVMKDQGEVERAKPTPSEPYFGRKIRATELFRLPAIDMELRARARVTKEEEEISRTEQDEDYE